MTKRERSQNAMRAAIHSTVGPKYNHAQHAQWRETHPTHPATVAWIAAHPAPAPKQWCSIHNQTTKCRITECPECKCSEGRTTDYGACYCDACGANAERPDCRIIKCACKSAFGFRASDGAVFCRHCGADAKGAGEWCSFHQNFCKDPDGRISGFACND